MNYEPLSTQELNKFQKYFGEPLEKINPDDFKKKRRELQVKYHPDKFEKHDDELVKEMALEKYQEIESLSERAKVYLDNKHKTGSATPSANGNDFLNPDAQYSVEGLFIEIITQDKKLKYDMFGRYYKWLEIGDAYKIPNTNAAITIQGNYKGRSVGFNEAIKIYLSFGIHDSIPEIIDWLYSRIVDRAKSLIIDKTVVAIDRNEMSLYIKKRTFLQLK